LKDKCKKKKKSLFHKTVGQQGVLIRGARRHLKSGAEGGVGSIKKTGHAPEASSAKLLGN